MSYNSLFGNPMHPRTNIHNDAVKANLGTKLNNVRDRRHTQQEIPLFDIGNSVTFTPVSAYGASLLDTTSLADLRATILENTNEEAIRLLADGNNEINFYTGGTGASNLKLQILDSSIDVKNSATLNTANVVVGTNNYLQQKIEDSDSRVFLESLGKRQYCLYSYEAGTNSGMLVQVDANDILGINNYKNSVAPSGAYRPISINRSDTTYVVMGASINPTSITANFVSNGTSVFCNAASPLLHISSSNIKPYTSIIPNGVNAEDLGNATNYFGETHTNKIDVKSDMFMNIFNTANIKNTGFFFRSGFGSGSGLQDNMSIRGHNNSGSNDGIMISAYGGVSINCGLIDATNDNGTNGSANRAMLINSTINNHRNMLPNQDGQLDIGSASLKFNEIYGNNIRAHTSLYAAQIRAYTNGNPIHFHNASLTFDANKSISVDNLFSSATNRDLYLGNGASDIKMRIINGAGGEIQPYSSIVPPNADGLLDLGSPSKYFGNVYVTSVNCSTVTGNDLEANVSIIARGNNAYISVEDDTSTNGKVWILSENSATYTGKMSFLKNDVSQLSLGRDNSLQFENGSNFTIKSDAQTYLSFIHDANFVNRKININVDLIPSSNSYDLGSANNRFAQIHGTTINASFQVAANQIAPYTAGSDVIIDANLRPSLDNNNRSCGTSGYRWTEVWAFNGTIQTSDRNSKKDITPIKNALNWIRKLKPVSYVWKDKGKRKHTGFIAQEVLESSPYGSDWGGYIDTNGDGLGLRYNEFVSVNTQAIKELDAKVSRLASGITGETKVDLNYHTDSSEVIERLEILENRELTPIVEEYDDTALLEKVKQNEEEIKILKIENKKQEDCISQLIADNMNLSKQLKMLMERLDKFDETPNVGMKIEDNSDILLSEGGGEDHAEMIESRLHTLETKVTKLSNKQSKLVTAINKLKK